MGRQLPRGLELGDLRFVAQGEADVVEAFEEPPPSVIIDLERNREVTDSRRLVQPDRR